MQLKIILGLSLIASFAASTASASDLWILDCDGNPQVAQQIRGKSKRIIDIKLQEVKTGEFVLISEDNSTKITGSAKDGVARFAGISAGSWRLCGKGDSSVKALALNVLESNSGELSFAELGLGGAAAGLAVAGFSLSDTGGSSSSASNELADQAGTLINPQSQSASPQSSAASASSNRGDCFVGNEVIPMSPFV